MSWLLNMVSEFRLAGELRAQAGRGLRLHGELRHLKGSLAVMDVLYRRHIKQTKGWQVCGSEDETIVHSIFECKHAGAIWKASEFKDVTSFADIFLWTAGKMNKEKLQLFASLAWVNWFCGNKEVFENQNMVVASGFMQLMRDYNQYKAMVSMVNPTSEYRLLINRVMDLRWQRMVT
ncbi:hypothetical protein AgCh_028347 [Apium graveolens]